VPAKLGTVTQIAAGDAFSIAVRSDASIVGWGSNADGALGVPTLLANPRSIDAGNAHVVVVRGDGTVAAWGASTSGQLAVPAGLDRVTEVACSNYATVAVREDGTIVVWGGGTTPGFGPSPAPSGITDVVKVVAKGSIAVVVRRATSSVPGDVNGDGAVDASDLSLLLSQWGAPGSADLDQSGEVSAADLALLLSYWS
jgi:alpha-tubulin suppressor-like RCC1 family protein